MHELGWRPIFLLNIPIGILAAIAAAHILKETHGRKGAIDVFGAILIAAGVLLISVPLIEGRSAGWPPWTFFGLAAAVPVFIAFAMLEARLLRLDQDPLIDIRLFRNRAFSVGIAIGFSYFAGFIGLMFALSLYLQIGLGFTALEAGLTLLAFAAGTFVGSAASDFVAHRIGSWVVAFGSGVVIVGIIGLIITLRANGIDVSGWELGPSLLVAGLGSGLVIAPNVDIALAGVPREEAGAAGGVLNTAQRLGNAFGVAVVGIALFGSVGAFAEQAATQTAPRLRSDLTIAFGDAAIADAAMAEFVPCFVAQARANDPTALVPGCEHPEPMPGDPVDDAFVSAAGTARKLNFTQAMQTAALYALGAVVVTFLLVFLLPKPVPQDEAW